MVSPFLFIFLSVVVLQKTASANVTVCCANSTGVAVDVMTVNSSTTGADPTTTATAGNIYITANSTNPMIDFQLHHRRLTMLKSFNRAKARSNNLCLIGSISPSIEPSPYFPDPTNEPNRYVPDPPRKRSRNFVIILASSVPSATVAAFFIWVCVHCRRKRRSTEGKGKNVDNEDWENSLLQATYLPKRFTYQELKSATGNFHKKLGGGGFGSVFEGSLRDDTKIAVKRLDQFGQGRKEFLAEVKTIGNIHHVSLVRLIGFCAENSHKLLVYEYMSNGSLDKWIFNRSSEDTLEWKIRKKIILNIAKGLAYLHDDCLLLPIVKQKAEENQLSDLVDKCTSMQQYIEEAEEMIRIAIWCLHSDPAKRPSMATLVKVLEGVKTIEPVSDYDFLTSTLVRAPAEVVIVPSEPQIASVLSGPR